MKFKLIYTASVSICILFLSTGLYAFGIGAYVTGTTGSNDWTYNISNSEDKTHNSDVTKKGLGLMLDTNLAYDRLFNYRMQIGYSAIDIDNEDVFDVSGDEYHFYNSFGFGVFRSGLIRVWLGPQIGCGFIDAKFDLPSTYNGSNDYSFFYLSGGIIAGINFNIGDYITLGIDGGYRVNGGFGTADIGTASSTTNIGLTGNGKEGFIDLCFVFRINDTFEE